MWLSPHADYVRFASHYGFAPDFCHAGDPQSKGIVEHLCGYAQSDLVVPLLTEAAVSGEPVSVPAANAAAAAWCAEVNAAVHSEICAVPDERLASRAGVLAPLPSLRCEIGAASVMRKVDRLSCVRYGSARYSVPTRLIGATVGVVVDHGALLVVEPATGAIVAEHELVAPGETSILDAHYDGPRRCPAAGRARKRLWSNSSARSATTRRRSWSAPPRSATPGWAQELDILLALGAAHGEAALVAALRRAVAFKRFRAADVRSILAAGTGTPQPRPAGDALVLDLPTAPTRSLDAYKITHP